MAKAATPQIDTSPPRLRSSSQSSLSLGKHAVVTDQREPISLAVERQSTRKKTPTARACGEAGNTKGSSTPTPARKRPPKFQPVLADRSPSKDNATPQKSKRGPKVTFATSPGPTSTLGPRTRLRKAKDGTKPSETYSLEAIQEEESGEPYDAFTGDLPTWCVEQIARALSDGGGCTQCLATNESSDCLCSPLALQGHIPTYPVESFIHLGDMDDYGDDSHLEMNPLTLPWDDEAVDEQMGVYTWREEDNDALSDVFFEGGSGIFAPRFMIDALNEFRKGPASTSTVTEDEDPNEEECREAAGQDVFWFSLEAPDRLDDIEWQPMGRPQSDIESDRLAVTRNDIESKEGEELRQDFAWDRWGKSYMPNGDEWHPLGALQGSVDPLAIFFGL
ncbi:hypothetical protein FA13DRAFT_1846531 [Coprinellus micaceus]|uniref:Uncharacterized protein n=1 Tax=Coprinellus micaceus TaxID=71717 RepID=A0A4Y7SD13_COPMI|nr:hypothetical protein FA13DRAFT_1846531 [Coprinellus micaceus]